MRITSLPPYLYKSFMPNLCQTDKRSSILRKDGLTLCGPVAGSNILIYLAKRHFPFIVDGLGKSNELDAQLKLVEKLAKYMKTGNEGTTDRNFIEGITKYVKDNGYRLKDCSEIFEGQRDFTPDILSDPLRIMSSVIGSSNTVLSVAFCKFDPKTNKYEAVEWHYITLAGFKNGRDQKLIIHDPSPATSREPAKCQLSKIKYGTFQNWYPPDEFNAIGFHELEGIGFHKQEKKKGADKIVLDGLLSFRVFRK